MTTDLGVLLPVRLETRFKNGDLWLRVVPDEPWFVHDDPRITPGELAALQGYVAVAPAPAANDTTSAPIINTRAAATDFVMGNRLGFMMSPGLPARPGAGRQETGRYAGGTRRRPALTPVQQWPWGRR